MNYKREMDRVRFHRSIDGTSDVDSSIDLINRTRHHKGTFYSGSPGIVAAVRSNYKLMKPLKLEINFKLFKKLY